MAVKMHEDEIATDTKLVAAMVQSQFPQWSHLPVEAVASSGTDHAIYRLGRHLAARLPRVDGARNQPLKESQWLPMLAPCLPLQIPTPVAQGKPEMGYPWHWNICPWIEGDTAKLNKVHEASAAVTMAHFVQALQRISIEGGPLPGDHNFNRGIPLAARDKSTRAALKSLEGRIDTKAAGQVWTESLETPAWQAAPVWLHGDLQPGNMLVRNGNIVAVIDFGGLAIGDPACDLMVAWNFFSADGRKLFREAVSADEATWLRGRGWALSVALIALPYYQESNPELAGIAAYAIQEVLQDYYSRK